MFGRLRSSLGLDKSVGHNYTELQQELERTRRKLERSNQRLKTMRQRFRRLSREWVLLMMPKESIGAEVGVDEGEFSRQILDTVRPACLHLIDPWEHHEGHDYTRSRYGGLGDEGQCIMEARYERVISALYKEIEAGSVKIHRAFSDVAVSEFDDHYFDWVYIDANHRYEFVKQDLEAYCKKIKRGGYLAGDDYASKGWWGNGVQQAVDEFVSQSGGDLQRRGPQFIIRV